MEFEKLIIRTFIHLKKIKMKESFEILNHLSPARTGFYCFVFIVVLFISARIIIAGFQTLAVIFNSIFKRKS